MTNYAFFDVDQTIYPGYSMAEFMPLMVKNGIANPQILDKAESIHKAFRSGKITYKQAGEQSLRLFAEAIKDQNIATIQSITNNYYVASKLRTWVLKLFRYLQEKNYQVVLASGAPSPIVQAIATACSPNEYHCSLLAVSDDKFSGDIVLILDDVEKSKILTKTYNLENSHVIAFGDSTGDIPMLSLANHAFIVDPHQPEMKDLALSHDNWYAVDEQNILDQVQAVVELTNS